MASTYSLGVIAAWFVLGQARIVFTSKMVEYRIDNADPSQAMAFTRAAAAARRNPANYDARGRRLLPWYLTVSLAYWLLVAGICCWAIYGVCVR
jgi:hypothetical protein